MFRLIKVILEIAVIIGVIAILMRYMPELINMVHKGIAEIRYAFSRL